MFSDDFMGNKIREVTDLYDSVEMVSPIFYEVQRFKPNQALCEIYQNTVFPDPVISHVMRCAIWYHLHNLKKMKKTHGGVLILVKLQAEACNFTKINTPAWVFFTFFKLYKCYQIAQRITYNNRIAKSVLVREIRVRENRILVFFVQWKALTEKLLEIFSESNFHS